MPYKKILLLPLLSVLALPLCLGCHTAIPKDPERRAIWFADQRHNVLIAHETINTLERLITTLKDHPAVQNLNPPLPELISASKTALETWSAVLDDLEKGKDTQHWEMAYGAFMKVLPNIVSITTQLTLLAKPN